MKNSLSVLFVIIFFNNLYSQIGTAIPTDRRVDWTKAGLHYGLAWYADEYIDVTTQNVGIAPGDGGDDASGLQELLNSKNVNKPNLQQYIISHREHTNLSKQFRFQVML